MKRISSIICTAILIAGLFFPVNYLQSRDWSDKECILIGVAIAGCVCGLYYITSSAQDSYHLYAMNNAREAIDKSQSITYQNSNENNEDENIRLKLEQHKKDLNKKWIFSYHKGLNIYVSLNLSGTMSAANIFCFYLNASGQGFLNKTVVGSSTNLNGDFIIENSRLGFVDIGQGSRLVSFNNCLLDDIKSKNGIILELEKSIVNGNIIFDKPGIVVIDKESIINGSLVNGRLVKNSDAK